MSLPSLRNQLRLCPRESKRREELFNIWKIQLASTYTDGYPIRGPYKHGCVAQELTIAKQKGRTLSKREPEQIRTVEGHVKRRSTSKRFSPNPGISWGIRYTETRGDKWYDFVGEKGRKLLSDRLRRSWLGYRVFVGSILGLTMLRAINADHDHRRYFVLADQACERFINLQLMLAMEGCAFVK